MQAGGTDSLADWMWRFRHIQAREIMETQGRWIAEAQPRFGPEVKERFDWAATITEVEAAAAREKREAFARRLAKLLGDDALLCLPTAPGIAPLCERTSEALGAHRSGIGGASCGERGYQCG